MITPELESFINIHKDEIDHRLPAYIMDLECPQKLKEAMIYSLKAGGKRIRPLLMLASISSYRQIEAEDYKAACSIEMVHTYSLIHDDLPAMDDDDYRRGQWTNHKVYGEAFAVLAGDALLTNAFAMIGSLSQADDIQKVKLMNELSKDAGAEGMVGGQAADLEGENKLLSQNELEYIHYRKTAALLQFSIAAGGILGRAPEQDLKQLRLFAQEMGLVFQIRDDILDIEGDEEEMGKATGRDEGKNKSTYPSLLTMEGAKDKLYHHAQQAKASLQSTSAYSALLSAFVDYTVTRLH